jgi:hypothetical protein
MFATPKEMACEYMRDIERRHSMDEYVEKAIDEYKTEAVKRLYNICEPFYAEAFAVTIAYGYSDGIEESVQIVNRLALNDKHIAALTGDEKQMMRLILDELQEHKYYEQYGD